MNYNYSSKTNPTVDKAVGSRISVGVESLKLQLGLFSVQVLEVLFDI